MPRPKKFNAPKMLPVSADAADIELLGRLAELKGKSKSALIVQWIHREARTVGVLPKTARGRKPGAE